MVADPPDTRRTARWSDRFDAKSAFAWPRVGAAVVILGLAAASLAISARAGAVPQNDDWSYIKSALALHSSGDLRLNGWGQMFLLGQLITAQPFLWVFGARTASLDVYGACATVLWLSCAYSIGRRCVGQPRALALVAIIAAWPGMALISSSFMTDAPSAAASLVSVAVGITAIQRRSRFLMVVCLLAGLLAFTVREQLVVGVVAVVVSAWVVRDVPRRFRVELTSGFAGVAVVCAVLEHLRHQMPNPDLPPFGFATLDFSMLPPTLLPCLFTVGLAMSPLAAWNLLTLRGRDLLDPGRLIGWVLGLLALGYVADWNFSTVPSVTLTNYITPSGSFPGGVVGYSASTIGVLTPGVWQALQVLGMVGGVVILGEAGARLRRPKKFWTGWREAQTAPLVITVYTLLLLAFVVGLAFGAQRQYDRYLIGLFPGVGLMLLRPVRSTEAARVAPARRVSMGVVVAVTAGFLVFVSLVLTVSTDVRDSAIWRAATKMHARGVPASAVNAGLQWDGYHASAGVDRSAVSSYEYQYTGQTWTYRFPKSSDCYIVTLRSMVRFTSWHLIAKTTRRPYGLFHRGITVYTYRRAPCRIPPRRLSSGSDVGGGS